jgi:hypothetical protein
MPWQLAPPLIIIGGAFTAAKLVGGGGVSPKGLHH